MTAKQDCHQFLQNLEKFLNAALPDLETLRYEIRNAVETAKHCSERNGRHSTFGEGAFLNRYILPGINTFLRSEVGMSESDARVALLSESFRSHPKIASASPVRRLAHPFRKIVGVMEQEIIDNWRGKGREGPVSKHSCPDLALRHPSPHKIVFEGKYHAATGTKAADKAIVANLYQAFFYLALPKVAASQKNAVWDYDYSCVLAYDGTPDQALFQAWRSLSPNVRAACWDGANVYMMILGEGTSAV